MTTHQIEPIADEASLMRLCDAVLQYEERQMWPVVASALQAARQGNTQAAFDMCNAATAQGVSSSVRWGMHVPSSTPPAPEPTPFDYEVRQSMLRTAPGSRPLGWSVELVGSRWAHAATSVQEALIEGAEKPRVFDHVVQAADLCGLDWRDELLEVTFSFAEALTVGLAEQWGTIPVGDRWPFEADWRAACGPLGQGSLCHTLAVAQTVEALGDVRARSLVVPPACAGSTARGVAEAAAQLGLISNNPAVIDTLEVLAANNVASLTLNELCVTTRAVKVTES